MRSQITRIMSAPSRFRGVTLPSFTWTPTIWRGMPHAQRVAQEFARLNWLTDECRRLASRVDRERDPSGEVRAALEWTRELLRLYLSTSAAASLRAYFDQGDAP
jgi:hypothetical protein